MRILYEHKDIMQLLLFKSWFFASGLQDASASFAADETYRYLELAYKEVRSIIWSNTSFCDRA